MIMSMGMRSFSWRSGKSYYLTSFSVADTVEDKRKLILERCPKCSGRLRWESEDEVCRRVVVRRSCHCGWNDLVYDGSERRR
jgi:hypothetical protein